MKIACYVNPLLPNRIDSYTNHRHDMVRYTVINTTAICQIYSGDSNMMDIAIDLHKMLNPGPERFLLAN